MANQQSFKQQRPIVLSASAISTLKACPVKYYNRYILGIRPKEDTESLRMGNSWHGGQEIMYLKPEQECPWCKDQPLQTCPLCLGTGKIDDPLDAMVRWMNSRYDTLFPGMPREAKEIERSTILHALFAYRYYYERQPVDVITTELPFRIPLIDPRTRKAIPGVVIGGKLDKLITFANTPSVMEHKSTSDDLAPESGYWGHLRLDTQSTIYLYACQRLQADGLLEPYGIKTTDLPVGSVLYDVWRKPQIKPKKLSQADTAAFVESGKYFDRDFEIETIGEPDHPFTIDGEPCEGERLKSGAPVIRETPDMFGSRLFDEIQQQPDRYFARRLLTRTSEEIERFEWELFSLYQSIASHIESDSWFHNEHQCDSYGHCDYCQFCFTGQTLDPKKLPAGFVNIFDKEKK